MSNKSFDEDDYFSSESEEEKKTSRVNATAPNSYAAEQQQDETKRSASTVSKRRSSVKRRLATDKECLDQIKNAFPRIDPAIIKNEKDLKTTTFAETVEQMRVTASEQIIEKLKATGKDFFHQFKKTSKIHHITGSQKKNYSLAELHDEYIKISTKSLGKFNAGQHFVGFLLNNNVKVRLVYYLDLDGYFPKRFNLRIKRENRVKHQSIISVVEKSLNEHNVCLEALIKDRIEQLSGNIPGLVMQQLSGRPVFGAFLITMGPRLKVCYADVSPLYLPENFWPQVAINKNFLHMEEPLGEILSEAGLNAEEKEEIFKKIETHVPQSIYGFKLHPVYTVRAALRRSEIIKPEAKPTELIFDTQPIYLKKDILLLKGKTRWRTEGRKVIEGEEPMKRLEMAIGEKAIEFYAEHQTEPWVPTVIDGKLPVNEYGNIELFVGVPKKCVHLKMKGVWRAAKTLGVEYSQAVTGFEKRRGHNYVIKEGIIVHSKDAKAVRARYNKMMVEIEAKEAQRQFDQTLTHWKKLFKVLLVKKYMKKNYYK